MQLRQDNTESKNNMGSRQDNYRIIQTTESQHNPGEIQKKILNKNIKTLKRPRSTLNILVSGIWHQIQRNLQPQRQI